MEPVDLTLEDSDEDEAQRKSIMRQVSIINKRRATEHAAVLVADGDGLNHEAAKRARGPGGLPAAADAVAGAGAARTEAEAPRPASVNQLLLELRAEREKRRGTPQAPVVTGEPAPDGTAAEAPSLVGAGKHGEVLLLTWNVWFREDVAVELRMKAIGDIIAETHAHFVCLQECTPLIVSLFKSHPWWARYACCAVPRDRAYFTLLLAHKAQVPGVSAACFREEAFANSIMGRSLRSVAVADVGGAPMLVATTHLESPCPPRGFFSKERVAQMRTSLALLADRGVRNVLFAGDMNWTDSRDGPVALPPGWVDAWAQLRPHDPGFTYDAGSNAMLITKWRGARLDRVLAHLQDWSLRAVTLVGTQPVGDEAFHELETHRGARKRVPVLPSDHYGLLLRLEPS